MPIRTPLSSTLMERGMSSLSAKIVRLSILPSSSVSSRTAMRSIGSFESWPDSSGRKPGISITHIRPSASQSSMIGESTIGSAATISTR